jgi:hypothetical protein
MPDLHPCEYSPDILCSVITFRCRQRLLRLSRTGHTLQLMRTEVNRVCKAVGIEPERPRDQYAGPISSGFFVEAGVYKYEQEGVGFVRRPSREP